MGLRDVHLPWPTIDQPNARAAGAKMADMLLALINGAPASSLQELWQPARFHFQTGIDYDIHDPYTDAFNKKLVASYVGEAGYAANHPNGKDGLIII